MTVSKSSVQRGLKTIQYSRKRLTKVSCRRNSLAPIDRRQKYCKGIESIGDGHLIFLDETGFNLHISKHYGYSAVGSRAVINVPANRETNISLLCVINSSGIVGYKIKEGPFNENLLLEFINQRLILFFIDNPYKN
ncbi:hypothetical protein CDIK_1090 [Cucumispora dikerogammari]|nr:hypothetical protein CDIK_1090 [Cucumispora dikerogammari]